MNVVDVNQILSSPTSTSAVIVNKTRTGSTPTPVSQSDNSQYSDCDDDDDEETNIELPHHETCTSHSLNLLATTDASKHMMKMQSSNVYIELHLQSVQQFGIWYVDLQRHRMK